VTLEQPLDFSSSRLMLSLAAEQSTPSQRAAKNEQLQQLAEAFFDMVMDVPEDALNIAFGVALAGNSQVWFDDSQFEVVGQDVPTRRPPVEMPRPGRKREPVSQAKPVNLDFEE